MDKNKISAQEAIKMPLDDWLRWNAGFYTEPPMLILFESWTESWKEEVVRDYDNRINDAYQEGWADGRRDFASLF